MKIVSTRRRQGLISAVVVTLFLWCVPARGMAPRVGCGLLSGTAPTIDGSVGAGEWPAAAALHLQPPGYPIETSVYCVHDGQNLYMLVDATGDSTDSNLDECLLVFDLPPAHKIVEIWRDDSNASGPIVSRFDGGASGQAAMGIAGHRVYEFKIALASINLQPGGAIPFYSPAFFKFPGIWASMPYDAATSRDNVFPNDLNVGTGPGDAIDTVSGYAMLSLGTLDPKAAPTLSRCLMAALALLLGLVGFQSVRQRAR